MSFNGACGSVLLIPPRQISFVTCGDSFMPRKYAGSICIRETFQSSIIFFLKMHLNAVLNKFLWTLNRHNDIGEAVTDLHAGF